MPGVKVLVLGAGANGLSSAVRIQEAWPGVSVTVMAETFSPDTTSDGSAGFWEAFAVGNSDPDLIRQLSKETYDYMLDLSYSPLAATVRAQQISGYQFRDEMFETELDFKDLVHGYRPVTKEETAFIPGVKDGRFFISATLDVSAYLKWLTQRFLANGGNLVQRKLNSLEELSPDWNVVVNCTGLGSFDLLNDKKMKPIRGQVFRVQAPWIKHYYVFESWCNGKYEASYVLPNSESVVVGGTFEENSWSREIRETDAKDIWDRAVKFLPSLKHAKILKRWAGLRPGREALRLEPEVMEIGKEKRKMKVVHNYGHGGAGLTLHWGCARKVVDMVSQFLQHDEAEKESENTKVRSKL